MALSTHRQTAEPWDATKELDWDKFPVREMYRRQWFEDFKGSLDAAMRNADILARDYVLSVIRKPAAAFHRKSLRTGSSLDEYALMAWECRVLKLGLRAELEGEFKIKELDSRWFAELLKQSSRDDGPRRAKHMLQEAGIALVIEPHLAKTYLDGAALLYGGRPIVGMTLRYDRLDNFWFVLYHELFHVARHLRKGRMMRIFDDLEVVPVKKYEQEADELGGEALISSSAWEHSLARYVRSPELVKGFASELGIDPAIVAGRIRREANNYIILADLVGQGDVRKHFPEVDFGA